MRLIIALILTLTAAGVAHATPTVPNQYATARDWTRYYGQLYLGGDWTVLCELEQASWDPHYMADTCVAKSVDPTLTFGLQYIQMEYATVDGSNGSVWDVLPYPQTYTWPDNDYAASWFSTVNAARQVALDNHRRVESSCSGSGGTRQCTVIIGGDAPFSAYAKSECDAFGCRVFYCTWHYPPVWQDPGPYFGCDQIYPVDP